MQKGGHDSGLGRICRAGIQLPGVQSPESRSDLELLYGQSSGADRSGSRSGESHAVLDRPRGPAAWQDGEPRLHDPGALDLKAGRMFITDFGCPVYSANLDLSSRGTLLIADGNLTGIAVMLFQR